MPTDVALMVYSMRSGGVERMRTHLADAFLRRGYSTSIVVARCDGHWGRHLPDIPAGASLVDLKADGFKAWLSGFADYLSREKPKVVIAAVGPPCRELLGEVPAELRLPGGCSDPRVVFPGVLAVRGPKYDRETLASTLQQEYQEGGRG